MRQGTQPGTEGSTRANGKGEGHLQSSGADWLPLCLQAEEGALRASSLRDWLWRAAPQSRLLMTHSHPTSSSALPDG